MKLESTLKLSVRECKLILDALGDVDPARVDDSELIKHLREYIANVIKHANQSS